MFARNLIAWVSAGMALAACSSPSPQRLQAAEERAVGAVASPLHDLNLVSTPVPPVLLAARAAPYAPPHPLSCHTLGAELGQLDAVLGPDLDQPASEAHASLMERGSGMVGDAAVNALQSAAEGLIPYRGWVRKLTGAERESREVAAAIAAGTVRRAYLKGLGQAHGCAPPAAPRHATSAP